SDARLRLIDDGNHLNFDELLRLAKLKHGDVGRGRLVIERRKIGVDYRAGLADVAHAWPCTNHKVVQHALERSARAAQTLLDSLNCGARRRVQIVDHVWLDPVTLVRMIMVDRHRRRAGEPKKLAALDFDGRYEWHEDGLVVIGMVNDLHVLILRLRGRGTN